MADPDVSSAEWIAEAPSDCDGSDCTVLPLANFDQARFLTAAATTTTGVSDSLTDAPWTRTRIDLGSSFLTDASSADEYTKTSVTATPTALSDASGAFDVAYASTTSSISSPSPGTPPSGGAGGPGGPPSFSRRHLARKRGR